MAKMVNAGNCPLILPNSPLKVIGIGDNVEVTAKLAEIPSVAKLIKDGNLMADDSKAAKSK